eukprot:TRINITY_DN1939_c0_g1_i2.p1 TRINITY_DN1939_c0_g1~~TRINITY_DN1939_c0_g1_i2.p1  ORF type:complete len:484 (-),score=147.55 TRINITY_DN1939_c0_g1_i2:840-2291(-)
MCIRDRSTWVGDSYAKRKFLPVEDYSLPPLQGLTFVLAGFDAKEGEALARRVGQCLGRVLSIEPDEALRTCPSAILVLNSQKAKQLYQDLKLGSKTEGRNILIHQWIETCISSKRCIKGNQYSCQFLFDKAPANEEKQAVMPGYALENEIKKLEALDADDEKGLFLSDCIVYCEKLDSSNERKVQKKLITLAGGVYSETYCKAVTHIILNKINVKNEFKDNIHDYSLPPFIVLPHWLRDSVVKGCRMAENKYKPIISENTKETATFIQKQTNAPLAVATVSAGAAGEGASMLFKGVNFCIKSESYTPERVKEIAKKIILHSGTVTSNKKVNYMVVNDGGAGNVLSDFGKVKDKGYVVVSHRWIDYCIKHKSIVSVEKNKQIYLLPLPFATPYKDIEKYSLGLTGLRQEDKIVLGRIFDIMGGKVNKNLMEVTHIITDKQAADKALEATSRNSAIALIDAGWLLDYLEYGLPPNSSKHTLDLAN